MEIMSYTEVRKRFAETIDRVNDDHIPIVITRQNGQKAVLLSLDDYNSYQETAYLMASPVNAERINKGIAEVEAGLAKQHELIEE
ncbi:MULTISPECIES: type II toxin-antitoxin system Phd/YefM family antitoxin [Snodgrassella]|uniref:Antitoxin n=1 Tax=Snodgrassella alvi SCGC AB-598-J21 TaxID=1385367 RepID=A0A074V661_9NEIS|nr:MULTISPECIES: type II toxin-antitoxin system prevent-host-death family antitoxin [Snodgrassella]KEQ00696.1 Antitoxin of toxin-antitoxin stability system [Snodgrassella alvi SCGC AB-598-J21]MCT6888219.1 type II toxin-antitoxin system prevent-host-death family antitoxin [Lactobacillus sp.]NUF79344.1 type II toxin-antitoxin system prevent-host-death family antitoxin [Snodgrassella sp. ESL0323]OOX78473.1 antitoxin [Snodgrassella alvi]ORE99862.1 antitoxin [Snodgrassella alvi]